MCSFKNLVQKNICLKEYQNLLEESEGTVKEGGGVLAVPGHLMLSMERRLQGETKGN